MKKLKLSILAFAVASAALLVGCDNPEKMKDVPQEALPKMDPNPLVLVGKTVEGKITGKFPPKYFNKNAKLELIPVLRYGDSELALPSRMYQGEKVSENNPVINFENGGPYSLDFSFPYQDEMMRSDMELRLVLSYKDKQVPFDAALKLGPGINVTQLLVDRTAEPAMLADNFVRNRAEVTEAQINFAIQKSDIRSGELTKDDVKNLQEVLKNLSKDEKKQLKGVDVYAYASPDGPVDLNENLSKSRGSATEKWLKSSLKKGKAEGDVNIREQSTDWEGFRTMVENSDIEDKDMILRVLSMYSDPDTRNKEMHNLGKVFQVLAEDVLPKLRRSKMVAEFDVQGRTDDEIRQMADEGRVSELGEDEAVYAAGLYNDDAKKESVYKQILAQRPNDLRANCNLAAIYLKQHKLAEAKPLLDKAAEVNPENQWVLNNQGVYEMLSGNEEEAEKLFLRATDVGDIARANLGTCAIMRGNYNQAVDYMKGTKSFNHGLAHLLVGSLDQAKNMFNEIKCAKSYYGLAIIGARNSDEKMIIDNLREAFNKDSSLKQRAKKDVEFIRYAQNEAINALMR